MGDFASADLYHSVGNGRRDIDFAAQRTDLGSEKDHYRKFDCIFERQHFEVETETLQPVDLKIVFQFHFEFSRISRHFSISPIGSCFINSISRSNQRLFCWRAMVIGAILYKQLSILHLQLIYSLFVVPKRKPSACVAHSI